MDEKTCDSLVALTELLNTSFLGDQACELERTKSFTEKVFQGGGVTLSSPKVPVFILLL